MPCLGLVIHHGRGPPYRDLRSWAAVFSLMPFVAYNGPGQKQMLGKSLKVVPKTSYAHKLSPLPGCQSPPGLIIPFLVGDPEKKPSFATVTGRGDNPSYAHKLFQKFPHSMRCSFRCNFFQTHSISFGFLVNYKVVPKSSVISRGLCHVT